MKTLLSEHDTSEQWKTYSATTRTQNKRQIDYEKLHIMRENWEEMIKLIYLKKQQTSWIRYNSNKQVIRKLSSVSLNGIPISLHLMGGKMIKYIQFQASDNPADLDTYIMGPLGWYQLRHCCNIEKQKKAEAEKFRY